MLNMINDAILLSRPLRWLFWLIAVIVLLISAWLYYAAVWANNAGATFAKKYRTL